MTSLMVMKISKVTPRIQKIDIAPQHMYDFVVQQWASETKSNYKPKTWRRYEQSAGQLKLHFGGRPWADVHKATVVEYVENRKASGTTAATVKRDLTVLSQVAEFAIEKDWSATNPTREVPKRALKHRTPVFRKPPAWCVEAIVDECPESFRAIPRFALATGARLDEIVLMRVHEVELERRCAVLPETKNGKARTIELSEAALTIVRAQLPNARNGWLFPSGKEEAYKEASSMWCAAARGAAKKHGGFVRTSFHGLRHLYAIGYLSSGGSIYWLQRQLGHGSIKVTEQYLAHLTPTEGLIAQFGKHTGTLIDG